MSKQDREEQIKMTDNGTIHVTEEEPAAHPEQKDWAEEFVVAGNEVIELVRQLSYEAGIRRIVIKNEQHDLHWEIPLVFGIAGMLALPAVLTMVGVATALMTECKIYVERVEPAKKQAS